MRRACIAAQSNTHMGQRCGRADAGQHWRTLCSSACAVLRRPARGPQARKARGHCSGAGHGAARARAGAATPAWPAPGMPGVRTPLALPYPTLPNPGPGGRTRESRRSDTSVASCMSSSADCSACAGCGAPRCARSSAQCTASSRSSGNTCGPRSRASAAASACAPRRAA